MTTVLQMAAYTVAVASNISSYTGGIENIDRFRTPFLAVSRCTEVVRFGRRRSVEDQFTKSNA